MAVTPVGQRQRAALEDERDRLLRSLDDLDAEHAAGDLDRYDYETLRDTYTARAAEVLRRLAAPVTTAGLSATAVSVLSTSGAGPVAGASAPAGDVAATASTVPVRPGPASTASGAAGGAVPRASTTRPVAAGLVAATPVSRARRLLVVGVLALFALVAGFALARAAGERGVNDGLTGAVEPSNRTRVLECQDLGASGALLESLQCFDEILTVDPDNAEALTYRGWYLLLAAGSLQETAQGATAAAEAQELIATGLDYLDRAIAADPQLPDPLAFRAVVFDRLGRSADACVDVTRLLALDPPPFFVDQTSALAARNGC